jgi:hypothetical protein
MDTGDRTDIDSFALDFLFGRTASVIAFRLAVVVHTKNVGAIGDAEFATDALVFIDLG